MDNSDWWMGLLHWRDVWRCVVAQSGAPSLMTTGVFKRHECFVDSWDHTGLIVSTGTIVADNRELCLIFKHRRTEIQVY